MQSQNIPEKLQPSNQITLLLLLLTGTIFIGERSEPLSDKLGGEICIATRALVCIYLY